MKIDQDIFIKALNKNGILFENGILKKEINYSGKDPNIDDKIEYFNSSFERKQYDNHSNLQLNWIKKLVTSINNLCNIDVDHDLFWTVSKSFWIHLCQTFTELLESHEKNLEFWKLIIPEPNFWDEIEKSKIITPQKEIYLLFHLVKKIKDIKKSFNDEELMYIDFMRTKECHVIQKSFDVKLTKDDKIRNERSFTILGINGVTLSIKDIDVSFNNLLKAYCFDEKNITIAFAKKIQTSNNLDDLIKICNQFYCNN